MPAASAKAMNTKKQKSFHIQSVDSGLGGGAGHALTGRNPRHTASSITAARKGTGEEEIRKIGGTPRSILFAAAITCLVPECGGISQADPAFREGLWAR